MADLKGMKAICEYESCSEATALKLIREEGYPAGKILGTWNTTTELVSKWREDTVLKKMQNQDPLQEREYAK